ncbi:MAG: hypothetical protein R3F49_19160 [Planctomycetota bacterium]
MREARAFQRHVALLSSPWMEGRELGSPGLELALEYVEHEFEVAGLARPYVAEALAAGAADGRTYRQSFDFGFNVTMQSARFVLAGAAPFVDGVDGDFVATSLGGVGVVEAPLVFVGYAIERAQRMRATSRASPRACASTARSRCCCATSP